MYKIRCKVAEPGSIVPPPDSRIPSPKREQARKPAQIQPQADEEIQGQDSEGDAEVDSDTESEKDIAEFIAGQCLFCNHTSKDLDDNLAHMQQSHSFIVPFQSTLAVDLQTLIWYLHMVVFSYRECIYCGKRRRTVEAAQQHMTSMGHCRFDVNDELSEFYHMDSLAPHITGTYSYPDDHTLRLPSGKLLGHRSHVDSNMKGRLGGRSDSGGLPSAALLASQSSDSGPSSQTLAKKDRQEQALTAQFSQLRTSDQMSLMHLPESQRRSLLASQKKELDKAKRSERRKGSRLDHVGNKTAIHTNYYKQEVPVYMGG